MVRNYVMRFAGLIVALSVPAICDSQSATEQHALSDIISGNYIESLERFGSVTKSTDNKRQSFAEQLSRSFVYGSTAGYLAPNDSQMIKNDKKAENYRDAIPLIVELAKKTNVVILNENHLRPRDRAFAFSVAEALHEIGYKYLAVEALNSLIDDNASFERMQKLKKVGHINHESGILTNDPVFANFLNSSMKVGYNLVSYDTPGSIDSRKEGIVNPIDAREEMQANNIIRRVFNGDLTRKVFIYVGMSHVAENPVLSSDGLMHNWMAARLKYKTGINPLTIDQGSLAEYKLKPNEIRENYPNKTDVVPFSNGVVYRQGQYKTSVDMQVLHLSVKSVEGRPKWLNLLHMKYIRAFAQSRDKKCEFVQIFENRYYENFVPVDQFIIKGKNSNVKPMANVLNYNIITKEC